MGSLGDTDRAMLTMKKTTGFSVATAEQDMTGQPRWASAGI
jgi:hypothetical protein